MTKHESIVKRLRKIRTLAERGEQGEALAARHLLEALLEKYGMNMADIMDDEESDHMFYVTNNWEKSILFQIYSKVTNNPKISYSYARKGFGKIWLKITQMQYIEIAEQFAWHKKQFKKESRAVIDTLLEAYLSKHKLFSEHKSDAEPRTMTEEERQRILGLLYGLEDVTYNKKLKQ